ncbi:MAG: hypothetical protein L6R35_007052 [Caloplaca aegaea]|nr:MAG: hypothetical protein L6R35_007052 [Caloplaca aegaea]
MTTTDSVGGSTLTTSMILQNNLIRNCLYPFYNIDDPVDKPGVLLASYTWSQEAQRIDYNLAQLHSSSKAEYDEVQEIIEKNYETHFAYDWYADPGTTGAFAYFGPGRFKNMYPYIVRNDGTHIIIGEASSAPTRRISVSLSPIEA